MKKQKPKLRPCQLLFCAFIVLAQSLLAQVQPIPASPANGSVWEYVGPHEPPTPGKNAGWSSTGTGAQVRVGFFNKKASNPAMLYASTPSGGLFRTRNVLDSLPIWENLTDSTRLPVLGVRSFAFDPFDSMTIYAGTGIRYPLDMRRSYGIGLLKSTDGGHSWEQTGLRFEPPGSMAEVVHEILMHSQNPDIIHVLCGKDYYRSEDGGDHFSLKKTNPYPCPAGWEGAFGVIAQQPGNPQQLYLTADAGYFFRSKDGGDTWEETVIDSSVGVTEPVHRLDVATSERNPALLYLCATTKKNSFLLRSFDGGTSWQFILKKSFGASYEKHIFARSPNDDHTLYMGGLYVHEVKIDSLGKATSRQISASNVHMDHRELCVVNDGRGGDILYSANDGGLYRASFDGKKWDWRDVSGRGFNNMQFYGIAVAEDYSVMPGGTQDLGTMLIRPDGKSTKPSLSGDGTDCAIDPYNPANIFSISWALGPPVIHKSSDGGDTWKQWRKGMEANGDSYYHPMIFHGNGNLYSATNQVYRLPYASENWLRIGDLQLPKGAPWKVTSMSVSQDARTIYALGEQLYRCTNAQLDSLATWEPLGEKMGDAVIYKRGGAPVQEVECDPEDAQRVWVGFLSYQNKHKVLYSPDGGDTWVNISRGLPPYPVNSLLAQAGTDAVLYAGTDVGVWVNFDATNPDSEWQPFNAGLPVCLVKDLEVNYCRGKLVAGTHGRGIWATPFAVPSAHEALEVRRDEAWDFRLLRNDVTVRSGAILTLRGEVRIAAGKKIKVEKDAKLVLDGAHLSELCGQPWEGIEMEEGTKGFLGLFFGKETGEVVLLNGGSISGARN
ncbi:MAG: hypothetical protein IT258_08985 [Saprospiraceae bacterium]|nr:hypothetical protein [Saprospiraceae bacterium]